MPSITLLDGSVKEFDQPVTPRDVALTISEGLANASIGALINGERADVNSTITEDASIALLTKPRKDTPLEDLDADALYMLRHSTAHVMAEAITNLWPDALLAYGPPLDNGFYYDISLDTPISTEDFPRIEKEMSAIIKQKRRFTRYELNTEDGLARLRDEDNKYKIDNAERAIEKGADVLSWYVTGEKDEHFEDMCMGPHIPHTGAIGGHKILSVAASNWHGDVTSDRFQRVYGTAFFYKSHLKQHLERLEEARQRDHRVLGKKLNLFHIDEAVGQGLILWKPNGAAVRSELQKFISEELRKQDYTEVFTPHIGKLGLYKTSGHFPYYQESQYPPIIDHDHMASLADEGCTCSQLSNNMKEGELEGYMLKPMNCPHHIKIFGSERHSYRDLPIRLSEFGTVYRWEQSGELGGMTRVRGFTQDDAHLFCMEDQIEEELLKCLELVKIIFKTLGMNDYRVRVGLRDPDGDKYIGEASNWDKAENACRNAAKTLGVDFSEEPGEAAFYGPKIDFVVKDVIGREWQLGTVQVDYNLPERFDLSYIGADNQPHRPVMIHRAPFGSMERFVGVLIEHFNGSFPVWLAPEQVRVLPISDKFMDYAQEVRERLKEAGLRTSVDETSGRLQAKIRNAQEDRVPYMAIVGGQDAEARTVAVRERSQGDLGAMPVDEFVTQIRREYASRGSTTVKVS